jgi:holliday junction resolvase Hjr
MSKQKGSNAERELIKMFWEHNWAAIRSAGSGSMHYPSPDLLVSNAIKRYAIEVKITKDNKKYFKKDEIKQLINFSKYFGAEPWIAIKFHKIDWIFISPEELDETQSSFVFRKDKQSLSLSFFDLIHLD